MKNKHQRHRFLLYFFGILIVLILLDFSPMLYQSQFGNTESFSENYSFDITIDSLLKLLQNKLTQEDKNFILTISPADKNGDFYVQVLTHKYNEYIHLWIKSNKEFSTCSKIMFYGISDSPNFRSSKIINRDYDYISSKLIINKFERLIISKLNTA